MTSLRKPVTCLLLALAVATASAPVGTAFAEVTSQPGSHASANHVQATHADGSTASTSTGADVNTGSVSIDADDKTVTREYTHAKDEVPTIPAQVTDADGRTFVLQGKVTEIAPGQTLSKPLVREVTVDAAFGPDPGAALEAELAVDEDGYAGTLELASHAAVPTYSSRTRAVDRTVVYENLPDNDVSRLPAEEVFTVSSDSLPGATTDAALRRASVTMAVASLDDAGMPNSYTATVVFRGEESYLEQTGWHVTGTYAGTVEKKDVNYITTATYTLQPPTIPTSFLDGIASAGTEAETAGFWETAGALFLENWQTIARILGIGLVVALFATAVVLYRRRIAATGGRRSHAA